MDTGVRAIALLALGVAFAVGALLLIRAGDARATREAAPDRALRQARDQQAATAEILGAMAVSPPDLQRVLDTIARNAARVCDGFLAAVTRFDGELIHLVAHHAISAEALQILHRQFPCPPDETSSAGRAIRTGKLIHVVDAMGDSSRPELSREVARTQGYKSLVVVPLLRDGRALGSLSVARLEGGDFSERQIQLLQTFADQAVIAIENVRRFTELQARNRELTETLEQQTATAEILRVMTQSPTDTQPVFAAILSGAVRLCDAHSGALYRFEDDIVHLIAYDNPRAEAHAAYAAAYPRPLDRTESVTRRLHLEKVTVHIADVESEPGQSENFRVRARTAGYRSVVGIPLLREDRLIGSMGIARSGLDGGPRPFSEREIGLLETFAAQVVIAIENVRLFQALQARNRELTESLEQQTATGEILRVISSSPTNTQPVFDAIVASAVRLCDGRSGSLYRIEHGVIHQVAYVNPIEEAHAAYQAAYPRPLDQVEPEIRRHYIERVPSHVDDVDAAPGFSEEFLMRARTAGYRSVVSVPMLREGRVIGTIAVARAGPNRTPQPFSDGEIRLLQTFADQAVIAIENVRLFQELEARNRELTESLEQQTATSEILRVISSSPTDLRPVFGTIVRNAARICEGSFGAVYQYDGERIHFVAHENFTGRGLQLLERGFPAAPSRDSMIGRAILDAAMIHVPDLEADEYAPAWSREIGRALNYRSLLIVPMLREGRPIGAIAVSRGQSAFSEAQISVVQTFADQAVIAIENVRLFQELEARNRELTESLEQQTATSEILRAISASPTDTQPVFDSIVKSTVRLCEARFGAVFAFDGELVHLVAHHNLPETLLEIVQAQFPMRPTRAFVSGRAILSGSIVQIPHVDRDPELNPEAARVGIRSLLAVPILRGTTPIGSIVIYRQEPGPFADKQIAVLKTFAEQGVIAVENVRLFRELEARTRELARSVEELQALSEVGRAVSSTLDLPTVLATIVARAVQLSGTSSGVLYEYDEATQTIHIQASHQTEAEVVDVLRASPIQLGEGATGRAVARRAPVEVVDLLEDQQFKPELRDILTRLGYRSFLSIPLLLEQRILGALTVSRREPGSFPPETVSLLQTFATQSALAIQNARLFREIEAKGRELEVASRHKSQFLANMSHELRTPLNAVLGYTELLIDGIYGELPQKAGDVMTRIDRSGKHLLGLINDVLDLSKIEAGQLELALADYALGEVVHTVVTQVESLAAEKRLILQAAVAPDLPAGRGDERRLAQVLLNLVGNAIKFTEVGSVRIAAHRDGDAFVVSIADTGPGIAEVDRQRIFEEFQQADSSSTRKKGGTGLGLSIARRIVELHGGRISVDSTVGRGSTFSFRVPVRVERQVARA